MRNNCAPLPALAVAPPYWPLEPAEPVRYPASTRALPGLDGGTGLVGGDPGLGYTFLLEAGHFLPELEERQEIRNACYQPSQEVARPHSPGV